MTQPRIARKAPINKSTKLPPTKTHLIKVKKGASQAVRGVCVGKRAITREVDTFSKKSKSIPKTGARLANCHLLCGLKILPKVQLIDVTKKAV